MAEITFLGRLAQALSEYSSEQLQRTTIVLPNRRSRVFLIREIQSNLTHNIFSPNIISIEDLIREMAGLRLADNIEVLFEFYDVYQKTTAEADRQPFEQFANWAKIILQDFNEIDRYLLDPKHILSYLTDIERIKNWSPGESRTSLVDKYLNFWNLLPDYYSSLHSHLKSRGIGYQGMLYREAIAQLDEFIRYLQNRHFVFAGLNALNAAEEKIIKRFKSEGIAEIFWDIDQAFLEDEFHDAGLFMRRFKNSWSMYSTAEFNWITDAFSDQKEVKIIGTPKTIGQAKIAGSIVQDILQDESTENLSRTAVVLGEENLLLPLLYSLPAEVGSLNITMGFPARNNPAQVLIAKLFKLHLGAEKRSGSGYVMYYKDILDVLTHPLVEPYIDASHLIQIINTENYSFITSAKLFELYQYENTLFNFLFLRWEQSPVVVLYRLSETLLAIKGNLEKENEDDRISKAFLYSVFKIINKLISFYSKYPAITGNDTLHAIYKQTVELAEVSFEGEPLTGLQIMGVLESRALDFETVIITSMNEGKFPAGKGQHSFIPYDVKREFGLPTFKEKDAIYTYHFYRLLQRAKNVVLLYNTDNEGLDGGEKSRFITQLEVEKKPLHNISHEIFNPKIPKIAHQPVVIPKSELVMQRLKVIAEEGFFPTNFTTYIRNPLLFYQRKILRIREVEEVEESIALNTLGTIIHETLRALYKPYIGKILSASCIRTCMDKVDTEVELQFREIYRMGEIRKGRNLLAFEVAKRNVMNFLKTELKDIEENKAEIEIIALETEFSRMLDHPKLPFPVMLKGNVDRIEKRNGITRIIDYKTGKVEEREMLLKSWGGLTSDIKNEKVIQVLAYAFIFEEQVMQQPMEVGIISFKNLKCGFMPFTVKDEAGKQTLMSRDIIGRYVDELAELLAEILDANIPFAEKVT